MADYISTLTGVQMDSALLDMAEHKSEAWAVGERNGVAVPSGDATYQNNARYYAQQAQSIKDECDVVLDEVIAGANQVTFTVDFITGELMYSSNAIYNFEINTTTGNLEWEVVVNG